MNAEQWKRLTDLLPHVRELPESEREAFLIESCAGDEVLAQELRRLARIDLSDDDFLAPPSVSELPTPGPDRPDLKEGDELGEFCIVREIGRGGVGIVHLAEQKSLERLVAVKVLPARTPSANELFRFRLEALATARIESDYIVQVFSAGESDGWRYIAMEYIDGPNLRSELDAVSQGRDGWTGGPPRRLIGYGEPGYPSRVAQIIRDVARALEHAHERAIIHRDITPRNILIDLQGRAKVVDFGLAKDMGRPGVSATSGPPLGTAHYMSPEQANLERAGIDHRTDIFSLGAVLYEAITLTVPFPGDTRDQVLRAIASTDPVRMRVRNPRVHRDLQTICERAMEKDPRRRFASAAAFADELDLFLAREPLSIRPTPAIVRVSRRVLGNRMACALGVLLLISVSSAPYAYRVARGLELDTIATTLRTDAASAIEQGDLDTLLRLSNYAIELRKDSRIARSARETLTEVEASIARYALDDAATMVALESLAAQRPEAEADVAMRELSEAQARAHQLVRLLPTHEDLRRLTSFEATLPGIRIDGLGPEATVEYRLVDPLSGTLIGDWKRIDATKDRPTRSPPGVYRFRISVVARSLELTERIDHRGVTKLLSVDSAEDASSDQGMVKVAGATVVLLGPDGEPREVTVSPFLIDEAEISIGEYRTFLGETQYPPPRLWVEKFPELYESILAPPGRDDPNRESEWDDRPMVMVSHLDATAYARWRGKRLPTTYELQLAARGPELRHYPWTDQVEMSDAEVHAHAVMFRFRPPLADSNPLIDALRSVAPVRDGAAGKSPFGLFHTLGNVKEWTETEWVSIRSDGSRGPDGGVYVVLGGGYDTPPSIGKSRLDLTIIDRVLTHDAIPSLGFRCARSTDEREK